MKIAIIFITLFTQFLYSDVSKTYCRPSLEKAALLVIDMQNIFNRGLTKSSVNQAYDATKLLIDYFRENNRPIFFTKFLPSNGSHLGMQKMWPEQDVCSINEDYDLIFAPNSSDFIISKYGYSAFANTSLHQELTALGIEEVVISGIFTNFCCESTARDAFEKFYKVFFIGDATATIDESLHTATLQTIAYGFGCVVTSEDYIAFWNP